MNILITGGCGHIGSYLIRNLDYSYNITVVDNLLTNRFCSLFDLNRIIKFIEKDIDDITIEELDEFDIVIHLAAITDAAGSFGNKKEIEDTNINKTKNLIDRCEKSKVSKFIFPSSTSVYGVSADTVTEDDDRYLNPQSPYAESKILIEKYLKSSKLNYNIFRFGTIFGYSVGMRFHTAINKFCYQSCTGVPLTIWKENYEQVRPYLGLTDCLKSIEMAIDKDLPNGIYNVLSQNVKLSDVVKVIKNQNNHLLVNFVDTPLLNQFTYNVSYDKISKYGFTPQNNLKHEIPKIIKKISNING